MTTDLHSDGWKADQGATQNFAADVSRLLHLMVHSVYSDRDIFVRELISNAADAWRNCATRRSPIPNSSKRAAPFAISIAVDPDEKTLTFADNGVGMDRDELIEALGTIASSGTRAFLDKSARTKRPEKAPAI